ncbi:transcriptional regulator opi1 [Dimargaris cristalligena]|uniref:Transcription factor Opi1-domain-containing protein n=1 Tax=Dimargaris cristalligena TaxID=215637 RepID=A0A4P9ZV82_9FUNG|nr:transcriptional regulator opi1 [Dimargaris cristalligena]RKP37485.1 transcription factor Opi1-domain-containing protein [Dimargaris cristalligena]|eukprot:RKP37485.1 transcription factor Opi1-domain-containing protein [Dimargaris cristalligena]
MAASPTAPPRTSPPASPKEDFATSRRSPIQVLTLASEGVPASSASSPIVSAKSRISVMDLCHASNSLPSTLSTTAPVFLDTTTHHDAEVQLAAQALGQLGGCATVLPAGCSDDFMSRVSNYPLVNTALRFYQTSKANSRVVKYGAETMEYSVKSICRPVLDRFEPNLADLDDFACKQLDKIERHYRTNSTSEVVALDPVPISQAVSTATRSPPMGPANIRKRTNLRRAQEEDEAARYHPLNHFPTTSTVGETLMDTDEPQQALVTRFPQDPAHRHTEGDHRDSNPSNQPRTWWQQVLVGAGTGALVFSEDSMRRIKYCLDWLQYAANHIQLQINTLREVILTLQQTLMGNPAPAPQGEEDDHPGAVMRRTMSPVLSRLAKTKREIVMTMKKVISIMSQYAGSALPAEARRHVRTLIMSLPNRWAVIDPHSAPGSRSGSASPAFSASPSLSPAFSSHLHPGARINPIAHSEANARKILNFATESQVVLNNVTGVFTDIFEGAQGWRQTFRGLGFNVSAEEGGMDTELSHLSSSSGVPTTSTPPDKRKSPSSVCSGSSQYGTPLATPTYSQPGPTNGNGYRPPGHDAVNLPAIASVTASTYASGSAEMGHRESDDGDHDIMANNHPKRNKTSGWSSSTGLSNKRLSPRVSHSSLTMNTGSMAGPCAMANGSRSPGASTTTTTLSRPTPQWATDSFHCDTPHQSSTGLPSASLTNPHLPTLTPGVSRSADMQTDGLMR